MQEDISFCLMVGTMPRVGPQQSFLFLHPHPSLPSPTFNTTEDLEALGSKPVGHEEEDDNKRRVQEAVAVWGFPLHFSMLDVLHYRSLGSPSLILHWCCEAS